MSNDSDRRRERDYTAAVATIEKYAEERAPGVLEMVDVYRHALPLASAWRPLNASTVQYSTSSTRRVVQ